MEYIQQIWEFIDVFVAAGLAYGLSIHQAKRQEKTRTSDNRKLIIDYFQNSLLADLHRLKEEYIRVDNKFSESDQGTNTEVFVALEVNLLDSLTMQDYHAAFPKHFVDIIEIKTLLSHIIRNRPFIILGKYTSDVNRYIKNISSHQNARALINEYTRKHKSFVHKDLGWKKDDTIQLIDKVNSFLKSHS